MQDKDHEVTDVGDSRLEVTWTDPSTPVPDASGGLENPNIAIAQSQWGTLGLRLVYVGLTLFLIVYELDNATVYGLNNYAASALNEVSSLGTLTAAANIVYAVAKLPLAQLSSIIGRGGALTITIIFYVVGYIFKASAGSFALYAVGHVLYSIGQSGCNIVTTIIIADFTQPRWRPFAFSAFHISLLITPWISGPMLNAVVAPDGIGWRWGIGLFAIVVPAGSALLLGTLAYYHHIAKRSGLLVKYAWSLLDLASQLDIGGSILFVASLSCVLLPLSIATRLTDEWRTPWVIALLIVGCVLLGCLLFYELRVANHPLLPLGHFRNSTMILSCLLLLLDAVAYNVTHTYLFAWSVVTHDLSPQIATYFTYTAPVVQYVSGIISGLVIVATYSYKWLTVAACVCRLVGYGLMIRLRGSENTLGELFGQQVIQGFGSGAIGSALLLAPQMVVSQAKVPQAIALAYSSAFIGASIGASVAGLIYTNTMRRSLYKWLGNDTSSELVDSLFNSITTELPPWGSAERMAIGYAYSDVSRYLTYVAVGVAAVSLLLCFLLPNLKLPRSQGKVHSTSGDVNRKRNGSPQAIVESFEEPSRAVKRAQAAAGLLG
ncbi:putative Siderochrome-iron transporter [Seiridium unicorne]|uniref:Siderochrome-iron transporter n=1 Tax=Seiridium unicorne TaxID=138068 RepID=A0ABR2UF01_9PEZI